MRNNKQIIRLIGLLILILFTVEYLEPSAVGVRIGHTSSPNQSGTKEKSSSTEKNGSLSPHAMIWDSLFLLNQDFSHNKFKFLPEPFFPKLFLKEIFHPPLLFI
jgi:hypothetical protein